MMGWRQGHLRLHQGLLRNRFHRSTEDLKKFDLPALIIHGDDDQIVRIGASAMISSKLVKGAKLKVYPGLSHGLFARPHDVVNLELLAFFKE